MPTFPQHRNLKVGAKMDNVPLGGSNPPPPAPAIGKSEELSEGIPVSELVSAHLKLIHLQVFETCGYFEAIS